MGHEIFVGDGWKGTVIICIFRETVTGKVTRGFLFFFLPTVDVELETRLIFFDFSQHFKWNCTATIFLSGHTLCLEAQTSYASLSSSLVF